MSWWPWNVTKGRISERREAIERRAAEERWKKYNAEKKAAGCPCGKPATRVRIYRGVVGSVPMEQWGCDDHYDADGYQGYQLPGEPPNYKFDWSRKTPCSECSEIGGDRTCHGWGGQTGGPTEYWSCPVRPAPAVRYDRGWE